MMPALAPDFTYSCQASAEHFQQCAEFSTLRIQMRRTPRGGQWYAKSVSNLLARA
jgi:hypothetical protein